MNLVIKDSYYYKYVILLKQLRVEVHPYGKSNYVGLRVVVVKK